MVSGQLMARNISDERVLAAFSRVPRELFVPKHLERAAYQDRPLPIGRGQTISQPYIVALMTELLEVKPGEKVLEVGTGSGYQAAILLDLEAKVYGVEKQALLAKSAREKINFLGYRLRLRIGDGTLGWAQFAPYDKIIVTAASPEVPKSLLKQVKVGGKVVIPVGSRLSQQLTVIDKTCREKFSCRQVCGCVFVPLVGKEGWDE